MHIVHPEVEKYIDSLWTQCDPILKEMEEIAAEKNFPIIGPEVGRMLAILARSTGATKVLELGSGYGYSAYWFARALPKQGMVICTDTEKTNRDKALEYFDRAGLGYKVRFEVGDALELIGKQTERFDIIFNDIDKEDYPASIDKVYPALAPGGLFITDNALWYAKVAQADPDKTTAAVMEFNRRLMADERFETVILPIRDGVAMAVRKG